MFAYGTIEFGGLDLDEVEYTGSIDQDVLDTYAGNVWVDVDFPFPSAFAVLTCSYPAYSASVTSETTPESADAWDADITITVQPTTGYRASVTFEEGP